MRGMLLLMQRFGVKKGHHIQVLRNFLRVLILLLVARRKGRRLRGERGKSRLTLLLQMKLSRERVRVRPSLRPSPSLRLRQPREGAARRREAPANLVKMMFSKWKDFMNP